MNELVLLFFHASWCKPCSDLQPTVSDVMSEHKDIRLVDIDVDENVEYAIKYKVRSIPTLVLMENEQEVARLVGNQSAEQVKEFLGK